MSHSDISPTSINVSSCATHLNAQDELINKTHELAWSKLWLSMIELMVVVVVVSRSKSRQKVVKKAKNRQRVQKLQRSEKFAKAIGSEERLPKHRSSVKELELPLEL